MSHISALRSSEQYDMLRRAVDAAEKRAGRKLAAESGASGMLDVVREFLRNGDAVCYGGMAINNVLPPSARFYDPDSEIPDYDFYTPDALADSKRLVDEFVRRGFKESVALSGLHPGTFKVYVNYHAVADLTQMDPALFANVKADAIRIDGILFAPPDFLRMSMYLELSRPNGDVSRWEKVYTRLELLNEHHPLKVQGCETADYGRGIRTAAFGGRSNRGLETILTPAVSDVIVRTGSDLGVVFIGNKAMELYTTRFKRPRGAALPDVVMPFYLVANDSKEVASAIASAVTDAGTGCTVKPVGAVDEIVPKAMNIVINGAVVCSVFAADACYAYHDTKIKGLPVRIGTIDTILSFYLALAYSNIPRKDAQFLMCASQYLFVLQLRHASKWKGLLKRFVLACYGTQKTLVDARAERGNKFKQLRKGDPEREKWFLRYSPATSTPPMHLLDRRGTISLKRARPRKRRRTIRRARGGK